MVKCGGINGAWKNILSAEDVMDGIADMISDIQVEQLFLMEQN